MGPDTKVTGCGVSLLEHIQAAGNPASLATHPGTYSRQPTLPLASQQTLGYVSAPYLLAIKPAGCIRLDAECAPFSIVPAKSFLSGFWAIVHRYREYGALPGHPLDAETAPSTRAGDNPVVSRSSGAAFPLTYALWRVWRVGGGFL